MPDRPPKLTLPALVANGPPLANDLACPSEPGSFGLVSVQFMQLPPEPRSRLFAAPAAAVRADGMLPMVGHHPWDLASGVARPPMPELFYTSDEISGLLDDSWTVEGRPDPSRSASIPGRRRGHHPRRRPGGHPAATHKLAGVTPSRRQINLIGVPQLMASKRGMATQNRRILARQEQTSGSYAA